MDPFQATRCLFESNSSFQPVSHFSSAICPQTAPAGDYSPKFTNDRFFFQYDFENHQFSQEKQGYNNFKPERIQKQQDSALETHNTSFYT